MAAYSHARHNTWVSVIALSAWLKPTQPASVNLHISVSNLPFSCRVKAPSGYTCAKLICLARYLSISTKPGSSNTGCVSGVQARLVTPPAAAACNSLTNVAEYSEPGSRKRALKSTKPGLTIKPVASIV